MLKVHIFGFTLGEKKDCQVERRSVPSTTTSFKNSLKLVSTKLWESEEHIFDNNKVRGVRDYERLGGKNSVFVSEKLAIK